VAVEQVTHWREYLGVVLTDDTTTTYMVIVVKLELLLIPTLVRVSTHMYLRSSLHFILFLKLLCMKRSMIFLVIHIASVEVCIDIKDLLQRVHTFLHFFLLNVFGLYPEGDLRVLAQPKEGFSPVGNIYL